MCINYRNIVHTSCIHCIKTCYCLHQWLNVADKQDNGGILLQFSKATLYDCTAVFKKKTMQPDNTAPLCTKLLNRQYIF